MWNGDAPRVVNRPSLVIGMLAMGALTWFLEPKAGSPTVNSDVRNALREADDMSNYTDMWVNLNLTRRVVTRPATRRHKGSKRSRAAAAVSLDEDLPEEGYQEPDLQSEPYQAKLQQGTSVEQGSYQVFYLPKKDRR